MLAKRTKTPTVFSGAIALVALSGCSLQDYDYLGADNKPPDDKTEETEEPEETTTSPSIDSSVETFTSETTDVASGPDASATDTPEETSTTEVTSSAPISVSTSDPEPTSSATSETSAPPAETSTSEETSIGWVPGPVVVDPNNLLKGTNSTFEAGPGDWTALGGAVLQNSAVTAYSGTKSMLTQGRTQNWEGPSIEVLNLLEHGKQYTLSGWVRTGDGSGQPFHIVRKAVCVYDGGVVETDNSKIYIQLAGSYTDGTWTQIVTPPFSMPDCDLQTFVLYFEGPAAAKSFYLDDVALIPLETPDAGP